MGRVYHTRGDFRESQPLGGMHPVRGHAGKVRAMSIAGGYHSWLVLRPMWNRESLFVIVSGQWRRPFIS